MRQRSVAYWEYGSPEAETIVLVHGFRGDHHGLERIAAGLGGYRVLVPDLPGFGESEAIDNPAGEATVIGGWLREFLESEAPNPRVLVGHSYGSIVVAAAMASGARAQSLALINPITQAALKGPQAAGSTLALMYYRVARLLPARLGNGLLRSPLVVRGMSELLAKTRDRNLRAFIHEQHRLYFSNFSDRQSVLEHFEVSTRSTVSEFQRYLSLPIVIIAGEIDDITPLRVQLDFHNNLPAARPLVVASKVGHLVHYEAPEIAVNAIEDLAASLG